MAETDGNIVLGVDTELNIGELKKQAGQIKKALDSFLSANKNGAPGLEKAQLQALKLLGRIESLTKSMGDVEKTKVPTPEFKKLQKALADAQKQSDKVNASIGNLSPKATAARSKVRALGKELREAESAPITTDRYKQLGAELAKEEKRLAQIQARMEKMRALGKDRSSTRGRPYTDAYKSAQYDEGQSQKKIKDLQKLMRSLEKSGENITYGDPAKIEAIKKKLAEARKQSKSIGDALKAAKNDAAGFEQKIADTEAEIKRLEQSGGAVEDKTADFQRQLQILTIEAQRLLGNIFGGTDKPVESFVQRTKKAFSDIRSDSKTMSDAFKSTDTFKALSTAAQNAAKRVKSAWKDSWVGYWLSASIKGLKSDFKDFGDRVKSIMPNIKKAWQDSWVGYWVNDSLQQLKARIAEIKTGAKGVWNKFKDSAAFKVAQAGVQRVASALKILKSDAGKIWDAFKSTAAFQKIQSVASSAFAKIKQSAKGVFDNLPKGIKAPIGALKGLGTAGKVAFKGIKAGAKLAGSAIKGIGKVAGGIKGVFSKIKSGASNAFGSLRKSSDSSRKHLLRSFIQYGLGFRSLFFLARRLRATVKESLEGIAADIPAFDQTFSSLSNTFNQLKGSIGTAIQPLVSALAPALEWIMNVAINAANAVATFIATLTGQKVIYTATKGTSSFAKSTDKATKATKKQKDAQEDLNKVLGEYDKLSVIDQDKNKNKDSGSPSGGGDGADSGGPSYNATPVDPTSSVSQFAQKLKDAWNKQDYAAIGKIVGEKFNEINKKIDEFVKWDNVGGKITKALNGAGEAFNSFMDTVDWEAVGTTIGDGLNTITNTIDVFLDSFDLTKLGTALAGVVNGVTKTVNWNKLGKTAAKGLNAVTGAVNNFVEKTDWETLGTGLADSIGGLVDGIDAEALGSAVAGPITAVSKTLNGFLKKFDKDGTWTKLGGKAATAMNSWFTAVPWDTISEDITLALDGVVDAFDALVTDFDWASAGKDIGKLINGFINIDWGNVGSAISTAVNGILTSFINLGKKVAWKDLGKKASDFLSKLDIATTLGNVGESISTWLGGAFDTITTFFETTDWGALADQAWQGIVNFFKKIKWGELIGKLFEAAGSALGAGAKFIITFGKNLWTTIKTNIKSYFDKKIKAAGGNVIKGVFTGIIDGIKGIGTWIKKNIFDKFLSGFKKAFGIASPSKKMKKMGGYIIDGLKEGLKGIWGKIKSGFTDALNNIKDWASNLWTNIKDWFKGGKKKKDEKLKVETDEPKESKVSKWWGNIKKWFSGSKGKEKLDTEVENKTNESTVSGWWGKVKGWFKKGKDEDTDGGKLGVEVENKTKDSTVSGWWTKVKDAFNGGSGKGNREFKVDTTSDVETNPDVIAKIVPDWWVKVKNAFGTDNKFNVKTTSDIESDETNTKSTISGWWTNKVKKWFGTSNKFEVSTKHTTTQADVNDMWDDTQAKWDKAKTPIEVTTVGPSEATLKSLGKDIQKGTKAGISGVKINATRNKDGTLKTLGKEISNTTKEGVKEVKVPAKRETDNTLKTLGGEINTKTKAGVSGVTLLTGRESDSTLKSLGNTITTKVKSGVTKIGCSATVNSVTVDSSAKTSLKNQMKTPMKLKVTSKPNTNQMIATFLANGGVVRKPTLGMIGEDGPEAVIPLKNNTEWLDQVSKYVVSHLSLKGLQIPKLATGQVIPPNRKFLAMLGDQTRGTNVETPLSVIERALENVFEKYMGQGQAPIYVQLNGRTIAEAVRQEERKRAKQFV